MRLIKIFLLLLLAIPIALLLGLLGLGTIMERDPLAALYPEGRP